MAKTVETEIEIEASAETVWKILADFEHIAEWNDFIRHIEGGTKVGDGLVVEIWLGDRKPMTFKPKVLAYDPGKELRWIGRVLIPGLFDGEHSFIIETIDSSRVRFVHRERFSGLLVPLIFGGMAKDVEKSFRSMNKSLKERAEASVKA